MIIVFFKSEQNKKSKTFERIQLLLIAAIVAVSTAHAICWYKYLDHAYMAIFIAVCTIIYLIIMFSNAMAKDNDKIHYMIDIIKLLCSAAVYFLPWLPEREKLKKTFWDVKKYLGSFFTQSKIRS